MVELHGLIFSDVGAAELPKVFAAEVAGSGDARRIQDAETFTRLPRSSDIGILHRTCTFQFPEKSGAT